MKLTPPASPSKRAANSSTVKWNFSRHQQIFSHSGRIAAALLCRYDFPMKGEKPLVRRLSPEFWAIIGSAVTLLVASIGIAALILTVAGWIREDMRSMDFKIGALDTKMSGEIKALDTKLSGEIKALDTKLSGEIRKLDAKVVVIDKRLAVVESHVLDIRPSVRVESLEKPRVL